MMRRKLIAVFAFVVVFFVSEVNAADWKYCNTINNMDYFYDTESILRDELLNINKIWIKAVLNEQGRAEYIKEHKDIEGIENVSYLIGRCEFNCEKVLFRMVSSAIFDSKGIILKRIDNARIEFQEIIPGSINEKLFEIICKNKE